MRNAETVLAVIRERGKRGLPLEDIYRQLYNPDLYLRAYGRLYKNDGAMTRGVTAETVDGMSLDKINTLIAEFREERFRWTPVRRVEIPKKNGQTRPLGIPTWRDKLLQEVMRSLLEAYYEPRFSDHSHGFRPKRGCHTALTKIVNTWTGTKWFIEGDIKGCFDNIDHQVLKSTLRENIHDGRFLRLIEQLLKAGYMAQWRYHPTLSGTPQGGIVSPLLANIYLDRLDKFVEQTLIPEYTRGVKRKSNPAYEDISWKIRKSSGHGQVEEAKALRKQKRQLSSTNPDDPDYRRLRYIRYADDFLLGFIGSKAEAETIKATLTKFLSEQLRLELSTGKTLITHATTQAARFLGYEIASQRCDTKTHLVKSAGLSAPYRRRAINGAISLRLPAAVVEKRCALYQRAGKPIHRPELLNDSDFTIVATYQSEYRGYVQYYALAQNIAWLNKLRWVMETSLLKTLAGKHKATVNKMARKYRATVQTDYGPKPCFEVRMEREGKEPLVARFGGIPLRRQNIAILHDRVLLRRRPETVELLQRLLADRCELCGSTEKVEVHHIRKLADLKRRGQRGQATWARQMASRQRKTLVVCSKCHDDIHAGRPVQRQARPK